MACPEGEPKFAKHLDTVRSIFTVTKLLFSIELKCVKLQYIWTFLDKILTIPQDKGHILYTLNL